MPRRSNNTTVCQWRLFNRKLLGLPTPISQIPSLLHDNKFSNCRNVVRKNTFLITPDQQTNLMRRNINCESCCLLRAIIWIQMRCIILVHGWHALAPHSFINLQPKGSASVLLNFLRSRTLAGACVFDELCINAHLQQAPTNKQCAKLHIIYDLRNKNNKCMALNLIECLSYKFKCPIYRFPIQFAQLTTVLGS